MREGELRSGDVVEVKSPAEILSTLDDRGRLDSLPFMAEMLQFCGRRFTVSKRADKVCDTSHLTGSRKLPDAVFLEDLRCDGKAHGGCQAECRLFWKEHWLRRADPASAPAAGEGPGAPEALTGLLARNATSPSRADGKPGEEVFRCQATEMHAASLQLKAFDLRPYWRELRTGNASLGRFLRVTARAAWTEPLLRLGLISTIAVPSTRAASAPPEPSLGLQPGDWVRVKTRKQIGATLSDKGRNRGLWFDREMLPYCGKLFRVRQRVKRIIDEPTGRMIELKNDCVTLEGVVCRGEFSGSRWLCTRAIFPYWRECWLERAEDGEGRVGTSMERGGA